MRISKTDKVRGLVASGTRGDYQKALGIARGFSLDISKKDIDKIVLAYEAMTHPSFYEHLGMGAETAISEGIQILKALYGQSE